MEQILSKREVIQLLAENEELKEENLALTQRYKNLKT